MFLFICGSSLVNINILPREIKGLKCFASENCYTYTILHISKLKHITTEPESLVDHPADDLLPI